MKRFIHVLLLFVATELFAATNTGRVWIMSYNTFGISRHLGVVFTPEVRYEFAREYSAPKGFYMLGLFAGPEYLTRIGKTMLRVPFLYYYMRFPVKTNSSYYTSHSFDIRPEITLKGKKWIWKNKFLFHNTFYSTMYNADSLRRGYSLMFRYYLIFYYRIKRNLYAGITEYPIFGIIADNEAEAKTGPGFTEKGFNANRFFVGLMYSVSPHLQIIPRYCFEIKYRDVPSSGRTLVEKNHYIALLINYKWGRK